jgi:type IV fimbrial biogenesis protein FimT
MKQEGKTLLELMVILTVIGIVSAMAGPNLLGLYSRIQMRAATEEIASELRLARQLAATHHDRVRVAFDFQRRTLETQFVNGSTTHHIYQYENKGIVIDEPSTGPEILFYPSGRSATATTIRLRSREGQIRKLTVGITGRVAIQ